MPLNILETRDVYTRLTVYSYKTCFRQHKKRLYEQKTTCRHISVLFLRVFHFKMDLECFPNKTSVMNMNDMNYIFSHRYYRTKINCIFQFISFTFKPNGTFKY